MPEENQEDTEIRKAFIKAKPKIRKVLPLIALLLILFLAFCFGAYYSCSKSQGFLTSDLRCIETDKLPYCRNEENNPYTIDPDNLQEIVINFSKENQ